MPPKSAFKKLMQQSKDSIKPKAKSAPKPIPEGLRKPKPPYKNTLRSVTFDKFGSQANERMMSTRQLYQEFDDWGGRGVSKEFLLLDKPYFEHVRERREQNELLRTLAKKHGASSDVYRETLKRVEEDNRGTKEKPPKPRLDDEGPQGEDPHPETVMRFGDRVRDQNLPSIVYHLRKHPKLIRSPVVTLAGTKYAPEMKVTVFEHAVRHGNFRLVQKLVRFHPSVDAPDAHGFQPMHYACYNSDYQMVEFLQSHGAKLEGRDSKGNPHIVIAAREGRGRDKLDILEFMLKSNIDADAVDAESGSSALMHAVRRLDLHSTQLLLEYNARQFPDKNGIAPLELAILSGHLDLLLLLIEHQPDVLHDSYAFGQSALHLAAGREDDLLDVRATTSGDLTQVILAKHPPLLDTQDRRGDTPLMAAVRQGNLAAVKWLGGSGADIEVQNQEHMTAVQLAAVLDSSVHKEILFFLRHYCGADTKFFQAAPEVLEKMEALDSTGKIFRERLGKITDMVTKPAQDGCLEVLVRHGAYGRALVARRRALEELSQEVDREFESRGGYNDAALSEQFSIERASSSPLMSISPVKKLDGGFTRPGSRSSSSSSSSSSSAANQHQHQLQRASRVTTAPNTRGSRGGAGHSQTAGMEYSMPPPSTFDGTDAAGRLASSPLRSRSALSGDGGDDGDGDGKSVHGNVGVGLNHSAHFLAGGASTTNAMEPKMTTPRVSPVKNQKKDGAKSSISPFRATSYDVALESLDIRPTRDRTSPEAIRKRRGGGDERGGAIATAGALAGSWVPGGARPLSPAPGQKVSPVRALAGPSSDLLQLEVGGDRGFAQSSRGGGGRANASLPGGGGADFEGGPEIVLECNSPDFGHRLKSPKRANIPKPHGFVGLQTETREVWSARPSIRERQRAASSSRPNTTTTASGRPASRHLSSAPSGSTGSPGKSPVLSRKPRHGDWGDNKMPPAPTRFPDFHIVAEFKRRGGVRTDEIEAAHLRRHQNDFGPRQRQS